MHFSAAWCRNLSIPGFVSLWIVLYIAAFYTRVNVGSDRLYDCQPIEIALSLIPDPHETKVVVCLFFFTGIPAHAQIITVIDATTRQIIAGVAVFSKVPQYAAITNAKGQVSMRAFSGADSIYFQHVSYKPVGFTPEEMKSKSYTVELMESSISLDEVIVAAKPLGRRKSRNTLSCR